jgi:signal transduction histidine kinase
MKRYVWMATGFVAAGLCALAAVAALVFSRDLSRVAANHEERMMSTARFVAAGLDRRRDDAVEEVEAQLAALCRSAGCERIVVADDLGIVWWSGHELIRRGDDIEPFLVDTALYRHCVRETAAVFTPTRRIGGSYFKSLYYPVILERGPHVVSIEADQEFIGAARRFRGNIGVLGAALAVILVCLCGLLVVIARRATHALEQARRNEHLAFLGRTSAEIAHELKNPLGIIKTSADVLRKKLDPDRSMRAFGFISDEIMRLSRMIDSILTFSRDTRPRAEPFAPAPIVDGVLERVSHAGADVASELPPGVRFVGDADAFGRIIDNLVRNAVQAADAAPTLRIWFKATRGAGRLCIADNGPGMSRQMGARAFEPFVSGREEGTGLGLAIVKTLCTRMGWRICIEETGEAGTRFAIDIPDGLWHESS